MTTPNAITDGHVSQAAMLQLCGLSRASYYSRVAHLLEPASQVEGLGGTALLYSPTQVLAVALASLVRKRRGIDVAPQLIERLAHLSDRQLTAHFRAGRTHIAIIGETVTPLMSRDRVDAEAERIAQQLTSKGAALVVAHPIDVAAAWRSVRGAIDTLARRQAAGSN